VSGPPDAQSHPANERVLSYAPGTAERARILAALDVIPDAVDLPMRIGGDPHAGDGEVFEVRAPHRRGRVLGRAVQATDADVQHAIDAALVAAPQWAHASPHDRAAVFLRAADLLSTTWRDRMNAVTMVGQSKTIYQAEIDAVCELVDFWRFNVHFAERLDRDQPGSPPHITNRLELRPLEGFVAAITPFNFTSIAGNLPTAPAIMGNVVVWKPSPTQQLAASLTMDVLEEAGLPPGVINMVTETFHGIWRRVADNLDLYRTYPRLVGETGGKDFVVVHPSADPDAVVTGLIRGAFEYQGQKCSAASRAYIPASLWSELRGALTAAADALSVGDPADLRNFMGAVIDERAFRRLETALTATRADAELAVLAGGTCDDSEGWFVRPTIIQTSNPRHELMERELFGPILAITVYPDRDWDEVLDLVDTTSAYALTGAIFATDRTAIDQALHALCNAAGNFYVNDKPTGAVVGQQPFGGSRASGTNDKSGSATNLARWVSPRIVKENLAPPTSWGYPHMDTH